MSYPSILTETTQKLKTKVLLFSGVSLFIGLTKVLPTKLSLIGLNFEHSAKILGWFLIIITAVLFTNFLIMLILDISKYFKKNIINLKGKRLTGDTIGLTYEEIGEEYDRQEAYNQLNYEEQRGTLGDEAEDIHRKMKLLENSFDNTHLKFFNIIELLFNAVLPIILAILGFIYLYCFLVK